MSAISTASFTEPYFALLPDNLAASFACSLFFEEKMTS
jgi:hypothetical protein